MRKRSSAMLVMLVGLAVMLMLAACSGGEGDTATQVPRPTAPPLPTATPTVSPVPTPTLNISATVAAEVQGTGQAESTVSAAVEAPIRAMRTPTPTPVTAETSTDPDIDRRFKDAVEKHIKTSWSTWAPGEKIGQCFITNAGSMTKESKEAVIEHGIDEAFDKVSGTDLETLSKVWGLCESKAASPSTSSSEKTPSATTTTTSIDLTSAPVQTLDFESAAGHQDFSDVLQAQFQRAVDRQFDVLTEKAGISVAVYQGGYLWRYAKGKASSVALGGATTTELTVGTPMAIGSTSKAFVAGLVLNQVDDGLYSLSDTLGSLMSGNEGYEALNKNVINPDATIEQLLTMTSGIGDEMNPDMKDYTLLQQSQDWKSIDPVGLIINDFIPPGTWDYSNSNGWLLGLIAEHVVQQDLNELYKSELWEPLGLVALLLPQDRAPANTAHPHDDSQTKWRVTGLTDLSEYYSSLYPDWYQAFGATSWATAGIITTPENLARWAYELVSDHGSAISPTARAMLLDSFTGMVVHLGGTKQEYGYHLTKRTITLEGGDEITAYGHPGGGGGITSIFYYSPELDVSIALLANSHSDAESKAEAEGKLVTATLDAITRQIFDAYSRNR